MQLALTKDLSWLIKSGKPANLEEAYDKIINEYSSLTKNVQTEYIFQLSIDIIIADKRQVMLQHAIYYLRKRGHVQGVIDFLKNEMSFPFAYDNLERDLKLTENLIKTELMRLKQNEAEYLLYIKNSNNTEPTEEDFYEQISDMSKFQGYRIVAKETSLLEYISIINRCKAHIKALEKHGR